MISGLQRFLWVVEVFILWSLPAQAFYNVIKYYFIWQSLFTGMHVFCIPYTLMKQDPTQWLSIVTKNKGNNVDWDVYIV